MISEFEGGEVGKHPRVASQQKLALPRRARVKLLDLPPTDHSPEPVPADEPTPAAPWLSGRRADLVAALCALGLALWTTARLTSVRGCDRIALIAFDHEEVMDRLAFMRRDGTDLR